jgi:hypothetical protein
MVAASLAALTCQEREIAGETPRDLAEGATRRGQARGEA